MTKKIILLGLGILIIGTSTTIWAHGNEVHNETKPETSPSLQNKTIPETWNYVDLSIKELAKEIQAQNYTQSKKELIKLKKTLDVLKSKTKSHSETPKSMEDHSNHNMNGHH